MYLPVETWQDAVAAFAKFDSVGQQHMAKPLERYRKGGGSGDGLVFPKLPLWVTTGNSYGQAHHGGPFGK